MPPLFTPFASSCTALCLLLGGLWSPGLAAQGSVVTTPQVRAELVAHAPEGVAAGKPLWLGLKIEHAPHWHTYWKNPGDSGLPTTLDWQLSGGAQAGAIAWPTPSKLPLGPLLNFGYEGTLLLPVPVSVSRDFQGESLDIKLRADWLVCKDVCIPEGGDFDLRLPAQAATSGQAALFEAARASSPQPLNGSVASASLEPGALTVRVSDLPAAWQGKAIAYFPEVAGVIQNAAQPVEKWEGSTWTARVPLDPQRTESPTLLPSVLVAAGETTGVQVQVAVQGSWPAAVAPPAAAPMAQAATSGSASAPAVGSVAWALLLALAGGALLNLMPCVFPVLSLKVLGFAAHGDDRRALALGGLAYAAGVVLSFLALAGMLLLLRAGGEQLGWGFQLQSPLVVAALAALFTLIGLNLAGVFEFGSVLPSRVASLRARHPVVDSLLTGVLAVAIASPCTAPFMGASLGLAATLPAAQALTIFGALGVGMALPYLAASLWPGVARLLPRPGAWMAQLRTVMAFPMFATVVWLSWVLGQQTSIDALAALLATLVALAFAAWALGATGIAPRSRAVLGTLAVGVLAAALAWTIPALTTPAAASPAIASAQGGSDRWQAWSPERVAALRADGKPVFVDFTAAWCVTCQFNKRTTLSDAALLADFDARGVVLLRADWTRRDAAITAELARLGRNGVPVYALYAPQADAPQVLSEILSVAEVRAALKSL